MAKNEISDYDETNANNTDISGIPVSNSSLIAQLDDIVRAQMGALKRWFRADLFRLRDTTTQTKLLAFDLSGLPVGTTTFRFPGTGGTVATGSDVTNFRNLWVNGSFDVSQENVNALGTTTGYYPADQVAMFFTAATAAMSVQRIQARSLANAINQVEFKTTTAKASLGATDIVTLTQNIEGSAIAAAGFGTAAAIPIVMRLQETLPAGTYHVHCTNSAANRHVAIPFTATGSAEVKTIVIPADTGGTWLTADGVIGMTVDIVLAAGATLTGGAASTWSGSTFYAASTQFNILSSTANVARIADVGVKLDPSATGVYGTYRVGETDAKFRSERYWEKDSGSFSSQSTFNGNISTGESYYALSKFLVEKAKVPAIALVNQANAGFSSSAGSANADVVSFSEVRIASTNARGTFSSSWKANSRLS